MEINVKELCPEFDFVVSGVSYIGRPRPNTAMYVSKKVEKLIDNLFSVTSCLVFAENGVTVPKKITEKNCFIFTDSPQRDYALFAERLSQQRFQQDKLRRYVMCEGGYYLGENVQLGENAHIEPGCLIGHDVVVGKNAHIKAGTIIKNAIIGDFFVANEKAVIGSSGFTMVKDVNGNLMRIPTLGKVIIGNHVEIGAQDNISCGSGGDTVIEDYVKLDALVYIAHDVHLDKNIQIAAGGIVGGFADVGEGVFMGFNASLKNRVNVGDDSVIGMGTNVIRSVESNVTVVGNPARLLES